LIGTVCDGDHEVVGLLSRLLRGRGDLAALLTEKLRQLIAIYERDPRFPIHDLLEGYLYGSDTNGRNPADAIVGFGSPSKALMEIATFCVLCSEGSKNALVPFFNSVVHTLTDTQPTALEFLVAMCWNSSQLCETVLKSDRFRSEIWQKLLSQRLNPGARLYVYLLLAELMLCLTEVAIRIEVVDTRVDCRSLLGLLDEFKVDEKTSFGRLEHTIIAGLKVDRLRFAELQLSSAQGDERFRLFAERANAMQVELEATVRSLREEREAVTDAKNKEAQELEMLLRDAEEKRRSQELELQKQAANEIKRLRDENVELRSRLDPVGEEEETPVETPRLLHSSDSQAEVLQRTTSPDAGHQAPQPESHNQDEQEEHHISSTSSNLHYESAEQQESIVQESTEPEQGSIAPESTIRESAEPEQVSTVQESTEPEQESIEPEHESDVEESRELEQESLVQELTKPEQGWIVLEGTGPEQDSTVHEIDEREEDDEMEVIRQEVVPQEAEQYRVDR
jgi:hypothetical protein